jgi:hypothetical protein
MAQHHRSSAPSGALSGMQDDGDRLAGPRFINVDRQKAAVVVGIEERELLAVVNSIFSVVDVEQDVPGYLLKVSQNNSIIASIMPLI